MLKKLKYFPMVVRIAQNCENTKRQLEHQGVQVIVNPMVGSHAKLDPDKMGENRQNLEIDPHELTLVMVLNNFIT